MTYAVFAPSPIADQLTVLDSGLTLTTSVDAATLAGCARSTVAHASGTHGAEFVFWGDADVVATLGIVASTAPVDAEVGTTAGIGWRLHSGEVIAGGAVVVSGLPVIKLTDIVGLRATMADGQVTLECYRGTDVLTSVTAAIGGPGRFAVSLASASAGALRAIVNSGQWRGVSPAINAGGWATESEPVEAVRVASEDYMSEPGDVPASTAWAGIVAGDGLATVASVSFWPWGTASRSGTAQVRVLDAAGALDTLTLSAARDVPVRVRQVVQGASLRTASPVARYVLDRIDIEDDGTKVLILRDAHDDLDNPLHQAVYLPSLSEALAWQPQPVLIGAVRSAPGTAINSDGSVQWISDAPLASVGLVLDRGAAIEVGKGYALSDDGQQIALYSPPLGPVLADVSTEPEMMPATLVAALSNVFGRIAKTAWSGTDAAAIDAATGYAGIGYYASNGATARTALSDILASYAADWYQDADGVLRIVRLIDPGSVADDALAFELDWRELQSDLTVLPDLAPNLSRRMYYQRNAFPLSAGDMITDLVQLPPARRQQLSGEFRGQVYASGELPARYAHAETATPMPSLFDRRADAQAEIDRICALYSVPRFFYAGRVSGRTDLDLRPGQVGRISYHRYGLQAGRKVLVTAVQSNRITGEHVLKFWGA